MGLDREKLIAWLEIEAAAYRDLLNKSSYLYDRGFCAGRVRACNDVIERIDAGDFDV